MPKFDAQGSNIIKDTNYTYQYIVNELKSKCKDFQEISQNTEVESYETINLSGIGYMSYIEKVIFTFKNESKFTIVCKFPTTRALIENFQSSNKDEMTKNKNKGSKDWDFARFVNNGHNQECLFYQEVAPLLTEIPVLKAYLTSKHGDNQQGYIIMQDLTEKNVVLQNISEGLSYEQLKSVVKMLAILHAVSRKFPQELMDKLVLKNIIGLDPGSIEGIKKMDSPVIKKHLNELADAEKRFEENNFVVESHLKYNTEPVITHADIWAHNLFFNKNDDGKASNEIGCLLDWQLLHRGNGINDLTRLINTSIDADIRQQHFEDILEFYLETFKNKLQELGLTTNYTIEMIKEMFNEHNKLEIGFSLMLLYNFYMQSKDEETKCRLLKRIEATIAYVFSH